MIEKLILTNDEAQLALLGEFIEETGEKFGLNEETIMNLNLVLEEAVSNVIFYAYPGETEKKIELTIRLEDSVLEIILRDAGVPFDPTLRQTPDLNLAAADREIGGLGIFLIRQLMDEVVYKREGEENVLRMRMSVPFGN